MELLLLEIQVRSQMEQQLSSLQEDLLPINLDYQSKEEFWVSQ